MRVAVVLLILSALPLPSSAQTSPSFTDQIVQVRKLFAEERWEEIVRFVETAPERHAELNYYYGAALARLERWDDARMAFGRGLRQQPTDKRFPLELAGVAFKQKTYTQAVDHLRQALRLDPADSYANDFLGSVYFLQGNLEAALKYWNRAGKPEVRKVQPLPKPEVDPVLLDRAFAFAPAAVLQLPDLLTTEARLRGLDIFPSYKFDLAARVDGKFDVTFRALERNGWGTSSWQGLLSLFRGLPFQSVHPEFFNLRRQAINFVSLVRWDAQKRRLSSSISGPFSRDSKRRYTFALDLRNENWNLHDSFSVSTRGGLNLQKQAGSLAIDSIMSGRWNWSAAVELSRRKFRNVVAGKALTPELLAQGFQLKQIAHVDYELWRVPERRFILTTGGSTQLGRIWSGSSRLFAKVQGSMEAHWFPQARGDDYEMRQQFRAGKTFGAPPFDELFMLGVERDNDLWLRAHIGTCEGRKGNAPLGRNYFLSNWELDKNIYGNGWMRLKLGPFLDAGRISDSSYGGLSPGKWLWDIGMRTRVRLLGVEAIFSYGKDLRAGNNAFYVTVAGYGARPRQ